LARAEPQDPLARAADAVERAQARPDLAMAFARPGRAREGPEGLDADAFADTQREDRVLIEAGAFFAGQTGRAGAFPWPVRRSFAERVEAGRQITASRFRELA
jgi:hypothetical protein